MAEIFNTPRNPEENDDKMSNIERVGAEIMRYEEEKRKGQAFIMDEHDPAGDREGAIDMERDPETGEWNYDRPMHPDNVRNYQAAKRQQTQETDS